MGFNFVMFLTLYKSYIHMMLLQAYFFGISQMVTHSDVVGTKNTSTKLSTFNRRYLYSMYFAVKLTDGKLNEHVSMSVGTEWIHRCGRFFLLTSLGRHERQLQS